MSRVSTSRSCSRSIPRRSSSSGWTRSSTRTSRWGSPSTTGTATSRGRRARLGGVGANEEGGKRRPSWAGLKTLVGFRPERLLDYVRFEAKASALGLNPALRHALAEAFAAPDAEPHASRRSSGSTRRRSSPSSTRTSGSASPSEVASPSTTSGQSSFRPRVASVTAIDEDGQPDFEVGLVDRRRCSVECKTASRVRYKDGDFKVEVQKTRDREPAASTPSSSSMSSPRACSRRRAVGVPLPMDRDLTPWAEDPARIQAIQRIDEAGRIDRRTCSSRT